MLTYADVCWRRELGVLPLLLACAHSCDAPADGGGGHALGGGGGAGEEEMCALLSALLVSRVVTANEILDSLASEVVLAKPLLLLAKPLLLLGKPLCY